MGSPSPGEAGPPPPPIQGHSSHSTTGGKRLSLPWGDKDLPRDQPGAGGKRLAPPFINMTYKTSCVLSSQLHDPRAPDEWAKCGAVIGDGTPLPSPWMR